MGGRSHDGRPPGEGRRHLGPAQLPVQGRDAQGAAAHGLRVGNRRPDRRLRTYGGGRAAHPRRRSTPGGPTPGRGEPHSAAPRCGASSPTCAPTREDDPGTPTSWWSPRPARVRPARPTLHAEEGMERDWPGEARSPGRAIPVGPTTDDAKTPPGRPDVRRRHRRGRHHPTRRRGHPARGRALDAWARTTSRRPGPAISTSEGRTPGARAVRRAWAARPPSG